MQSVLQQPSCLARSFCSNGSSTGLVASCVQIDSGNRNTQWLSVICQHYWSQSYHLSTSEIYRCFHIFIAWLNLHFGVETCFYDGMDAYSKTWLQLVFPVYMFAVVGLIVLVSNFSSKFARLLGNNPISVLATLILFSYTKIFHTLITVLYVTNLEYPT